MIMKQKYKSINLILISLLVLCLTACKVNTLEGVEGLEQKVSLVQSDEGEVALTTDNMIVDKTNLLLKKAFGVTLSGFKANDGFTADLQLDFDNIPDGYDKLSPAECYLTETATSTANITSVNVPAGAEEKAFYLNITKAAVDAHAGKNVAVKLMLTKTSKYTLNTQKDSAYIYMNTADFGTLKTDVTSLYFKNTIFARQPGTTDRFANLADWITNTSLSSTRPTGAGFDANVGYMGIERWASYDSSITNGQIYQTFTLPAGNYKVEVAMQKVASDGNTYFVAAEGNGLPDAVNIGTAIAKTEITDSYNNQTLVMNFKLTESKKVSIGFLINIDQGVQKILQASGIKFFKVENLFD